MHPARLPCRFLPPPTFCDAGPVSVCGLPEPGLSGTASKPQCPHCHCRVCRPLVICDGGRPRVSHEHMEQLRGGSWTFTHFLQNGLVEYLDVNEVSPVWCAGVMLGGGRPEQRFALGSIYCPAVLTCS